MKSVGARPRILPRQVVTTVDGAELCTDIYLPETDEPRPAVLVRTPYGRHAPLLMQLALRLSHTGFCAVLQDCRGRYRSTGAYDLQLEAADNRNTLRWLARQEWCDGRAGLVGISISSLPNLMVASDPGPDEAQVGALVDVMGAVDYYRMCYRNGALLHHWTLPWTSVMGSAQEITDWRKLDWPKIFRHRPLLEAAARTGASEELWRMVVSHSSSGWLWRELTVLDRLADVRAPVLQLAGWQDFMLDQTLLAYGGLARRPGIAPGSHRLVVGPWDHKALFMTAPAADTEEDPLSLQEIFDWWFHRWLGEGWQPARSRQHPLEERPAVVVRVTGSEAWIGVSSFPPQEAAAEEWFLTSDGPGAGGGCGQLVRQRPGALGMDGYDYDPADPVPTLGGSVWPFAPARLIPGDMDQSPVEQRPDVLLYTSAPLLEDLVVIGPVTLEQWAASSACDTDFTGKLVDVDPCGTARWVQDGILRCRFRNGTWQEELLEPQRPYRLEIPLGAVAHRFAAGHRLRLEVASSNFPKFDNNLNTAVAPHLATSGTVARQAVFHGGAMASCLRLLTLPADGLAALRVAL